MMLKVFNKKFKYRIVKEDSGLWVPQFKSFLFWYRIRDIDVISDPFVTDIWSSPMYGVACYTEVCAKEVIKAHKKLHKQED